MWCSFVDPAFGLVLSGPAASAGIFARSNRPGAGRAADARVALRHERVAGEVVVGLVRLDLLVRPQCQGIDLDEFVLGVPLDDRRLGARCRVYPARAGGPRVVTGE